MASRVRLHLWVLLPLSLVWLGFAASTALPGVYMDAVNPDYLVAHLLGSGAHQLPAWVIPGNYVLDLFPLMPQVHHGALTFWIGLPFYALFGTDVVGIRLTNAAFASIIVLAAWWMVTNMGARKPLAAVILAAMAIDPAFQFIFRTQFYITTLPVALLFVSIALVWPVLDGAKADPRRRLILSGIAAGLATYGYFHHAFYVATLALFVLFMLRRQGGIRYWVLGGVIGVAPIVLGWTGLTIAERSLTAVPDTLSNMGVLRPAEDLLWRLEEAVKLWRYAFDGQGTNLMMLGDHVDLRTQIIKDVALIVIPVLAVIALELSRRSTVAVRLLLILAIVPPLVGGLLMGSRLWAHHYALIVPIVYGLAVVVYSRLADLAGSRRLAKAAIFAVAVVLVVVNANSFRTVEQRLVATGGVGFYSDAINRFAAQANGDSALYMVGDWGLGMPLVMLTRGDTEIATAFDAQRIEEALCGGQDVVVASLGPDAASRSEARAATVGAPGPTATTLDQRDGTPVIYQLRWAASDREAC